MAAQRLQSESLPTIPMLRASDTATRNSNEQPEDARAPFTAAAPSIPTGGNRPSAHAAPHKCELQHQQAAESEDSDRLSQWSWSCSGSADENRGNFANITFDGHVERDAGELCLLDKSFYGFDQSGLNDSPLQFDMQELQKGLSLDNKQLHVHFSPNRPSKTAREHPAVQEDMAMPDELTAFEFDTYGSWCAHEMAVLVIEETPRQWAACSPLAASSRRVTTPCNEAWACGGRPRCPVRRAARARPAPASPAGRPRSAAAP